MTNKAIVNEWNRESFNLADSFHNTWKKDVVKSPFIRWHHLIKFRIMQQLFTQYLYPRAKFIDIACGDGDGLILAQLCQPDCELTGVDNDEQSLSVAKNRVPNSHVFIGDMLNLEFLPEGSFDVLHEFGATFYIRDWAALAYQYLRLVRKGGVVLWELPQKWSAAHLMYMLSLAPPNNNSEAKIKRFIRSFSPSKFHYYSDSILLNCLESTGYEYEIIDKVPIWHFYARGLLRIIVDYAHKYFDDREFEVLDRMNKYILPRYSGYYIVIRRK